MSLPTLPLLVLIANIANLITSVSPTTAGGLSTFTLSSATFADNTRVPQSIVFNGVAGNKCTGGNESPQLSWANPPRGTKSFAVLMFDVSASFTHWGMYNIAPTTFSLNADAGIASSKYGAQIINDFHVAARYDGPCPRPGIVHHYVITVYALDERLTLPSQPSFQPKAETLFNAMLGHVLGSASITGLYST